jgi:hypothetical protein
MGTLLVKGSKRKDMDFCLGPVFVGRLKVGVVCAVGNKGYKFVSHLSVHKSGRIHKETKDCIPDWVWNLTKTLKETYLFEVIKWLEDFDTETINDDGLLLKRLVLEKLRDVKDAEQSEEVNKNVL